MQTAVNWLLEPSQPAIRYLAMRDLLDANGGDLNDAQHEITSKGWVADILAEQKRGGYWVDRENLYRPKYISTNWMLLTLSDLGVTKREPLIAEVVRSLDGPVLEARWWFRHRQLEEKRTLPDRQHRESPGKVRVRRRTRGSGAPSNSL